jgi:hypothetical protein
VFNIVDGFTLSTTLRLLPTLYRAHMYAQMEVLRKAGAYKARYYTAPDTLIEPIPAYGQLETQVRAIPGTYVWGLGLYLGISLNSPDPIRIQITDTSTEIPLFSDYIQAILLQPGGSSRAPSLLAQPRLITEPGQLNVEMYNDNADPATVQLVLYCAEPIPANPDIREGNHFQRYERLS